MKIDGIKLLSDPYVSDHGAAYHADSCEAIKGIPEASADFIVYSPPFASLFTYSASDHDLGNCRSASEFGEHFAYLATELHRILKPGRIMAVHCMDLPTTLVHDGYIGFVDFPGQLLTIFQKAGFIYHCPRVTIWKDPEVAANRTYARQLTYHEMVKDSAMSGVGAPDYILILRKPGKNEVPISHTDDKLAERDDSGKPRHWQRWASPVWATPIDDVEMLWRRLSVALDAGDEEGAAGIARKLAAARAEREIVMPPFPQFVWATANGIWHDGFVDYESPRNGNPDKRGIDQGDTLNFRAAREDDDERHICPLQVGVVDRLIDLYTKPGETVFTPFMGIGTEAVCAIKRGRKGVGIELKGSYYQMAVRHIQAAEPGAKGEQLTIDVGGNDAGREHVVGGYEGSELANPDRGGIRGVGHDGSDRRGHDIEHPQQGADGQGVQPDRADSERREAPVSDAREGSGQGAQVGICEACDGPGPIGTCKECGGEVR